jgi:hypothetical protein
MKNSHHIIAILLMAVSCSSYSEDLTTQKKQLIDELLILTGAVNPGDSFSDIYIEQMTYILQQARPELEARAYDVLEDEINKVVYEEVGDGNVFNEMSYPIYHKYLTIADLSELISFYNSPIGKKTIEVMPSINREAIVAGQQWGRELGPIIQGRLLERFEREGINLMGPQSSSPAEDTAP